MYSSPTVDVRKMSRDIYEESIVQEKHQYSVSTEITEMLYLVNYAIRVMKNLEAAEHWFLRRMLRIPWTDKVSKCEVLRRAGVGKELMQDMISRQMTFLGHVIRKDELEKVVLTGDVEGTRDRGNQRETFLTYHSKHKGMKPSVMIRQAIDRDMWIQLCRT